VSDGYKVMFLQGGGMGMFSSVPLNLLGDKTTADYLVTGNWSAKAASEVRECYLDLDRAQCAHAHLLTRVHVCVQAKKYCDVNIVADSTDTGFTTVPERATWKTNSSAAYLHYCDNETVHGTTCDIRSITIVFTTTIRSRASVHVWLCQASSSLRTTLPGRRTRSTCPSWWTCHPTSSPGPSMSRNTPSSTVHSIRLRVQALRALVVLLNHVHPMVQAERRRTWVSRA
jgi:hypothetical protein